MMEKLGAPQTHLGLKNMIKEVDEDLDSKLSFREVRGQGASALVPGCCAALGWAEPVVSRRGGSWGGLAVSGELTPRSPLAVPADFPQGGGGRAAGGQRAARPGPALRDRRLHGGGERRQELL